MGMTGTKYFVIMLVTVSMLAVILLNQLVSASIAMPLKKLNNSVKEWETGNMNPSIYIGGSMEVEHLGCTLRSTVEQIRQLMQDIVVEQEEKEKVNSMRFSRRSTLIFCIIHLTRSSG